jgi:hypothetical protein
VDNETKPAQNRTRYLKILIFIEVDVVVRHFVNSGVFEDLGKRHELLFVFPEIGNKRFGNIDLDVMHLPGRRVRLKVHEIRRRLWKRLFQVSLFRFSFDSQKVAVKRLYSSALGWKASLLYQLLALPGIFQLFELLTYKQIQRHRYVDLDSLFEHEQPTVVLHPCVLEGSYINDLTATCRARGIPSVVIMNSWDNPSTKRSMVGRPDWLLVWGRQTQIHAQQYIDMPIERIIKLGVAQFDVYRQPVALSREEFCQRNNLDPKCRILLYAGSSKGTDEISHLTVLDRAIESGELGSTVVLYRPHPWGGGGKNGHLLIDAKWKHVQIEFSLKSYLEQVKAGFTGKYLPDYQETHETLTSVDAVISPLSTIVLEAALHAKPVMCFLPLTNLSEHFRRDLALAHFQDMFDIPEIFIARGEESLLSQTKLMLERVNDQDFGMRLSYAMNFFVEPYESSYSSRLCDFFEKFQYLSSDNS